ncbi:MAG: hypothetical protein IKZ41_05200 [Clostridia bacterium]|nr:hypothetical protein [Clostridia bacterium]
MRNRQKQRAFRRAGIRREDELGPKNAEEYFDPVPAAAVREIKKEKEERAREYAQKLEMPEKEKCPMRHENGNCLTMGGFCTSVNQEICAALRRAYIAGRFDLLLSEINKKILALQENEKTEKEKA